MADGALPTNLLYPSVRLFVRGELTGGKPHLPLQEHAYRIANKPNTFFYVLPHYRVEYEVAVFIRNYDSQPVWLLQRCNPTHGACLEPTLCPPNAEVELPLRVGDPGDGFDILNNETQEVLMRLRFDGKPIPAGFVPYRRTGTGWTRTLGDEERRDDLQGLLCRLLHLNAIPPRMLSTPPTQANTAYLAPLRDMDDILVRIDALFACLQDVSEEKQQLYFFTAIKHYRDLATISDRSTKQDAMDYNRAVKASIDAKSLDPVSMQGIREQIDKCHKDYKNLHDSSSWNTNRTFALDLCTDMRKVLIPITRRLKSYADETTASASGTLETIVYTIKGDLRSNKFDWDKSMLEAQGKYTAFLSDVKAGKAQPIRKVDDVIASSIRWWYSPENKSYRL